MLLLLGSGLLAACLPPGVRRRPSAFEDRIVFSGLQRPTAIVFAPDGRVFVAEQSGLIKVFDGLSDTSPMIFADLRTESSTSGTAGFSGCDRPQFPSRPYVYVSYTFDAARRYGATLGPAGADGRPLSQSARTSSGRVVSGRLSRLTASGDTANPRTY